MASSPSERAPLLPGAYPADRVVRPRNDAVRYPLFTAGFLAILTLLIWTTTRHSALRDPANADLPALPQDPLERAYALLERHPLIDGHIDLPILFRERLHNDLSKVNLSDPSFPGHVNIPKLREGRVGGFFWSAFVPCADWYGIDEGVNFTTASWRVRDTLEQIDIAKLVISKHSEHFALAKSSGEVEQAFRHGKVASLIGLEGAHQLGNSLATLRQCYELGARYVTLTHTCNNAFAGSCGYEGKPIEKYGLTAFGKLLIAEMARLGMIIDISHTSEETARDVLRHSQAPVIFSHSNARGVWDVPRNVPDDILESLQRNDTVDAVVMATFAPQFVSQHEKGGGVKATLSEVADHIEYIARKAGRQRVGIGSDFDGIFTTPEGLEDVSRYPYLFAELIKRGWSDDDLVGLAGGNFLRIFKAVERVAFESSDRPPDTSVYSKRPDL